MDRDLREILQRILNRMDSLEDHLQELTNRLDTLEKTREPDHIAEQLDTLPENRELVQPVEPMEVPPAAAGPSESQPAVSIDDVPAQTPPREMAPAPPIPPAVVPPLPPETAVPLADELAPPPVRHAEKAVPPPVAPAKQFGQATAGFRPGAIPSKKPKESIELRIASYWLPRAGLALLAIAAILLAREYAQGPLGKIVSVYGVSLGLIVAGLLYEKKYPMWARPVLAGGLAFSYFGSYAMGFVEPMRLLDSLGVKLAILAANLALIFGVAQWKKSEVIAGTALILGYVTTGVVGNDMAAFCSSLALSVAALLFLWLNKWFVSTALAAAATYGAHLYVWQALPTAERSPAEAFWYHCMFLSLYFVVFTAAGLAGRRAALEEARASGPPFPKSPASNPFSRVDMLTVLTQVNVAAYIAGMITLLKITGIYWDEAWLFFLPAAIVLAGLGLLFRGLKAIQGIYLVAATVCLTFGIAALASPMWLPVFMILQATLMLRGTKGAYGEVWKLLSVLVLGTGVLYLVSGGMIDVLRLSTDLRYIRFPWWTFAASTSLMLVYVAVWDRWVDPRTDAAHTLMAGAVSLITGGVWNLTLNRFPEAEMFIIHGAAVPVVAMAMALARIRWFAFFVAFVAAANLVSMPGRLSEMPTYEIYVGLLGFTGLAAAYLLERARTVHPGWNRWLWRIVYIWGQLLIIAAVLHNYRNWQGSLWLAVSFAAVVAAGWLLRSASLAKSALVMVPFLLAAAIALQYDAGASATRAYANLKSWWPVMTAIILAVAAYPLAMPAFSRRTGDTNPALSAWGQAATVFAAGLIAIIVAAEHRYWNFVLTAAVCSLIAAVYAAAGLFSRMVWVYLAFAAVTAILLFSKVGGSMIGSPAQATAVAWYLLAVLLIVLGERVLSLVPARRFAGKDGAAMAKNWILGKPMENITAIIAVGTLAMAVMALRILPEMRLFYFTGAMVMAAFVWIVFGFWFNEPVYRKSGFLLLLLGIAKGVIWDLWSLKQNFYRIVSGAIVGLLAIAASFLYTKFRGRIGSDETGG